MAGNDLDAAVAVTDGLVKRGLTVTIDHLGEDTVEAAQAFATRDSYTQLLSNLRDNGLASSAEVSLKLSALGNALPKAGTLALDNARSICAAAEQAGAMVTLDMEDHTTVDSTLECLRNLRVDFPSVGVALQSCLLRTEGDVRDLAHPGSRIRMVKGAYAEPRSVAYARKAEVDQMYARCLAMLFERGAYPMVATHDSKLTLQAIRLAEAHQRKPTDYELQMLYGIRTSEQRRHVEQGRRMTVYVPYGEDWYGYFMRRLAERPSNVHFFLRSLLSH